MAEDHAFVNILATLIAIIIATKLLGALAQRFGQPAVLGELIAGVILGAAVIDDVIGLIILSIVTGLAAGVAPAFFPVLKTAALAFGFIAAAIVVGRTLVPTLFGWIARIEIAGTLGLFGLAFAFIMAWLAEHAGSAMIIGAFAAGLVLNPTPQRRTIERATTEIGHFFVPVFFAAVGAAVDIRSFLDPATLAIGGALIVVGIVGKMAAGYAPWWFEGNKALIGSAMIPRGEVGLIFAQMGLATGAIDVALFSALALMVMVTTFAGPPLLQYFSRADRGVVSAVDLPGQGGVDDLVAGEYGRPKKGD